MFATSQPEKSHFGQPVNKCDSKAKALTQQFPEGTPLLIPFPARGALCSKGQSLTRGWSPASCHSTSCHLAVSTPALCSQENPALLLSHTRKSQYDQQFLQLSLRKVSTTHPHFTNIPACPSKCSVRFFRLAFSHWNSEECILLKKLKSVSHREA